ncbi:MAG: Beta-galactosidase C-terminal domain [Armatimonadetes bacterium]|nr:Beta-galactosidase C-terminal domain [Candidatus Hippobium faecium]
MLKFLFVLVFIFCSFYLYAQIIPSEYHTGNDTVIIDDASKIKDFDFINENRLSVTDDFVKEGKNSILWEWTIDKYRNQMVGIVKKNINRNVPEKIEFYIYPNKSILLYVGLADKKGNRIVKIPVPGVEGRTWNHIELNVDDMLPFAVGADRIEDVDSMFLGTQDGAGEYPKSGVYSAYLSEIKFIYPYGKGIPQKYTMKDIDSYLSMIKIKRDNIVKKLAGLNEKGFACPYEVAALTVVNRFMKNAKEEAEEGKLNRAQMQLSYLSELSDRTLEILSDIEKDPSVRVDYKEADMNNLELRDGVYYDGKRPVFMFGVMGWFDPADYKELRDCGFNFTAFEFAMTEDNDPEIMAHKKKLMDSIRDNNLAFAPLMSPHYVSEEMYENNPTVDSDRMRRNRNPFMPWAVRSEEFMELVKGHLNAVIPMVKPYKNCVGYDLINELWYECLPDFSYEQFRKDSISFDNPWTAQGEYTKHNVYEFLKQYQAELLKLDDTRPIFTKTIGNMEVMGADREVLTEILTGCGVDQYTDSVDPTGEFALDCWNQAITLDTFRCFDPNKMVYDGEYHINPYSGAICSEAYTNFVAWNSFLRGKDMSGLWVWGRNIENEANCIYCQPWEVFAAGKACMDVNRVAEYVVPFAKQRGEFAIFYGGSDFENLYKAADFSQVNFDLVTDKMIEKGIADYKFVMYMDNANISKKSLDMLKSRKIPVIKVRTGQGAKKMRDSIKNNIKKTKIEKPVDLDLWGVEVRSYSDNGKIYYYLMNYNKKSLEVTLPKISRDLLTGKTYQEIKLEPMDVYLLEM